MSGYRSDKIDDTIAKFTPFINKLATSLVSEGMPDKEPTHSRLLIGYGTIITQFDREQIATNPQYRSEMLACIAWFDRQSPHRLPLMDRFFANTRSGQLMQDGLTDFSLSHADFRPMIQLIEQAEARDPSSTNPLLMPLGDRTTMCINKVFEGGHDQQVGFHTPGAGGREFSGPVIEGFAEKVKPPIKPVLSRRALFGITAGTATVAALGAGGLYLATRGESDPFVFDISKEVKAQKSKSTTLSPAMDTLYGKIQGEYDLTGNAYKKTEALKSFQQDLRSINNLEPAEQGKIMGRLLYHAARTKQVPMIESIFKLCPDIAEKTQFVDDARTTPVGIRDLVKAERQLGGRDYDIERWGIRDLTALSRRIPVPPAVSQPGR